MAKSVDFVAFLDVRFASFAYLFNNTGNIAACEKVGQREAMGFSSNCLPRMPPTGPANVVCLESAVAHQLQLVLNSIGHYTRIDAYGHSLDLDIVWSH